MVLRAGPAAALLVSAVTLACAPAAGTRGDEPPGDSPDAAPDVTPDVAPVPPCQRVSRSLRSPTSITGIVALVNALPRPVTLSCFLESLNRPLYAYATRSVISLQPSVGTRSPRVFLFLGGLVVSIVPEGTGSHLAELGEFVDEARTVKAEIAFPVPARLAPADPYDHVRDKTGTICRGCHAGEAPAEHIDLAQAFVSGALRPAPRSRVDLEVLARETRACDDAAEPARCAILRALIDHGELRPREFPPTLPTFSN